MEVLDLFSGMGGLASGFSSAGFNVTGVDNSRIAGETFVLNGFGTFMQMDLSVGHVQGKYDLLIGGPPCRPWSSVNRTATRGEHHRDYGLVGVFFEHVIRLKPSAFLFENVVPVSNSDIFNFWLKRVKKRGYVITKAIVRYSDFGAATRRRRLFVAGNLSGRANSFLEELERYKTTPSTVRSRIWSLKDKKMNEVPYHIWPRLRTIDRYIQLYKTGKYGWYKLKWDEPAPSFGNIMKTYILHPGSFNGDNEKTRVISVLETALLMGFDNLKFPSDTGMGAKYQMIVDSVSPVFSRIAADISKKYI